jgi:uncharacterized phage protein gp47/JayE
MTTYGLTTTGFVPKTEPIIRAELGAAWQAAFGSSVDVSDGSLDGQHLGIYSEREALLWELAEILSHSQDPDAVTGAEQDQLYALTGTLRRPATHATTVLTLTGTAGTSIPTGSRASVAVTLDTFDTLEAGTLAALSAWVNGTGYVVGDRVTTTSGGVDRAYVCITAGTSAGSGGPITEAADITDNTAHWRYMGRGAAADDVAAWSTDTGVITAASGDIATIATPIGGWSGVINLSAATAGTDAETDGDFRLRREQELAAVGQTTADAIRADLLELPGVTSVTVFMNVTDATDIYGVPPHAVEAMILGGVAQDIVDALFGSCIAAGIATYGTSSGTATDSEGTTHAINYTRPADVPIYVDITYTYDALTAPSDHEAQVKAAVVAFGALQKAGKDAVASQIGAQAFKVAGVIDVPRSGSLGGCLIKTSAGPTADTTIAISRSQLATYDAAHITVTSTPGTP